MTMPVHCAVSSLAARMRLAAARATYDGQNTPWARSYIAACSWQHVPTRATLIFTRDAGMHTSGWWKNPDYELCQHLSVSFVEYDFGRADYGHAPQDHAKAAVWCEALFGRDNCRLLWIEPPFSEQGKARDVYHYRLFCDPSWQPIKPRGEVYSKRWTPADWKSWSDVHGVDDSDGNFGAPNEIANRTAREPGSGR